jgi:hypothetical protein
VVAEVACRHNPKRAYGRQRARFGAPQGALAVSDIVDDLSVTPARKGEVAPEHVARIESILAIT